MQDARATRTPSSSRPPTSTPPARCSPASAAPRCSPGCATATPLAIEDDYDAEYRYDRAAIGALQGLEPDRVAYAGSASKTLAPALRLGWLVVPPPLLEAIRSEKYLADMGTERIGQQAFAHFLERGELDRHLRRMRGRYRARRDALVQALADELPDATVKGIAAGLHVTVEIPECRRARARRGGRAPPHPLQHDARLPRPGAAGPRRP